MWWNFLKLLVVVITNITEMVEMHIEIKNYAQLHPFCGYSFEIFTPRHSGMHIWTKPGKKNEKK